MFVELIAAAVTGAAVTAIFWRYRRLRRLQEQLEFIKEFVVARDQVAHDPLIPVDIKHFLDRATRLIDSVEAAQFVFSSSQPKAESRRSPMLERIKKLPQEQQQLVFAAFRCFFMALSYQAGIVGVAARAEIAGAASEAVLRRDVARTLSYPSCAVAFAS